MTHHPETRRLRRWWSVGAALLLFLLVALAPVPAAYAASDAKLVLVLDSSGSMQDKVGGDSKISIAKSALNVVVNKLPADAQVGLRVYGATISDGKDPGACTDSQLVVPIGTANRDQLRSEIAKYKPNGETPISYSLKQAAADLGGSGQRSIVLVSDGKESCDVDPCVTAASIAKQGINLKIDVIGLRVDAKARSQLQCIARKGNGTYYDADNKQQIEDSLDKLATRALRPFRLTGTPIKGSTDKATAPVAAPGQYVDSFGKRDQLIYYRVPRTMPGSTLHLGFTARSSSGGLGFIRLHTLAGVECGSGIGASVGGGGTEPLLSGEVQSWRSDDASPCNNEPELLAEVEASGAANEKFELLVREEAPVLDTRDLPPASGDIDWEPMSPTKTFAKPPVAGSSISDAPALEPGTYETTILTGETQVFAVNADWGQRVQVQLAVAPRRGALARVLSVADRFDMQLLGPMRGRYANLIINGLPQSSNGFLDPKKTYRVAGSTPEVRYLNRGRFDSPQHAGIPGPQYVALNMSRDPADQPFLVPYTLTVKVIGTAGEGAPAYAGPPTPSPSPTPTPSTEPGAPPQTGGVSLPVVIGIAAGAVVLGAGGAVLASILRRRRRQPPTP